MRQTQIVNFEIKLTNGNVISVNWDKQQSIKAFVASIERSIPYDNILLIDQENKAFSATRRYLPGNKVILTVYDIQIIYLNQLFQGTQLTSESEEINRLKAENQELQQQIIELKKEINLKAMDIKELHTLINELKNQMEQNTTTLTNYTIQKDQEIQELKQFLTQQHTQNEEQSKTKDNEQRIKTQLERNTQKYNDQQIQNFNKQLFEAERIIISLKLRLEEAHSKLEFQQGITFSQDDQIKKLESDKVQQQSQYLKEIKELKDKLLLQKSDQPPTQDTKQLQETQQEIQKLQSHIRSQLVDFNIEKKDFKDKLEQQLNELAQKDQQIQDLKKQITQEEKKQNSQNNSQVLQNEIQTLQMLLKEQAIQLLMAGGQLMAFQETNNRLMARIQQLEQARTGNQSQIQ